MSASLFDELNELVADDEARAEYRHELAISAFTNSLARVMADQRVSQAELARRLGVSRARVSQIMQHRCSPTLRTIMQLSSALGCDLTVAVTPGVDAAEARGPRRAAVCGAGCVVGGRGAGGGGRAGQAAVAEFYELDAV